MQPTYEELFAQNQILIQKIQLLEAEIKDLNDKLNTNSSNSSKPPSQDPFRARKINKTKGLKQGAQNGFGPRLMGLVTSLSGEFRLSKRQVTA